MQCPHCGQPNKAASRFCGQCGQGLTAAATPAAATVALAPHAGAALVIGRPGLPDLTFPLTAPSASLGRADSCDIVVDAPGVSRLHALVVRENGAYKIRDQGSMNGLYVAGRRVEEALLCESDPIRIPDPYGNVVTLTCLPLDAPAAAPPAPAPPGAIGLPPHRDELSIGRDAGNDVTIDLPLVSRRHARLERQDGAVLLHDLNSTNGTFVNGQRLHGARALAEGDEIAIGPARFTFHGTAVGQIVEQSTIRIDAVDLVRRTKRQGGQVILDTVSLTVLPQEFVAVVGGSGAGKSTLLHALCGAAPAQSGLVLFNGQDFYRNPGPYSGMIGYVPQDDILHRELPVERALDYAARLRLPPDTTPEERARRIGEVLADVKMEPQRGQAINKLSGGQRKRISIAVELLANPSVLFLDEPTSGLDPGLDKTMMSLLRLLCDNGRTIVLVTHATENINLCTLAAFVAGKGRLVYFGPPSDAPAFFGVQAFSDIYSFFDQNPDTVEQREQLYRASPQHRTHVLDRRVAQPVPPAVTAPALPLDRRRARAAAWRQWTILTQRYAELLRRDRVNLGLLLAQAPIVALLLIVVASGDSFTPAAFGGTQQVLLMLTLAAIWFGTINAAREIVKERPIYLRERMVNLRIWPYVLSKFSVLAALSLAQAFVLLWIVTLKTPHLPAQGILTAASLEMYVTLALTALAGVAGGLLISSLVSSSDRAMSIVPVILIAQVIFSGGPFDLGGVAGLFSLLAISRWCLAALGSTVNLNGLYAQLPTHLDDWPKTMYSSPGAAHLLGYWLALLAFTGLLLVETYLSLRRGDSKVA